MNLPTLGNFYALVSLVASTLGDSLNDVAEAEQKLPRTVHRNYLGPLSLLMALGLLPAVHADDLAFSDPALGLPAPSWAVGQANRTPQLDVAPGFKQPPADWALNEGLASYSGGAWYRKTIQLPAGKSVQMDLGNVRSSAEVRVNGKTVGVRITPPWTFDISGYAQVGENRIEVLVYNTLANHYSSVPTRYRGSPVSGLLGPVQVRISP